MSDSPGGAGFSLGVPFGEGFSPAGPSPYYASLNSACHAPRVNRSRGRACPYLPPNPGSESMRFKSARALEGLGGI